MIGLSFRQLEVLSNVNDEWHRSAFIRGALRMSVQHTAAVLGALRTRGLVESRLAPEVLRAEWRLTEFGRQTLEEARNA